MAKLILSLDHALLNEYPLNQERLTIGRRPSNDVQIDNLAVSGEHAAVVKLGNDFYIEDLNSTNGTLVNATPIKKHLLQHEDLIEFGKYQIRYINEKAAHNAVNDADFEKTMIIRPSAMRSAEQITPAAPLGMPKAPAAPPEPITPQSTSVEKTALDISQDSPAEAAKPAVEVPPAMTPPAATPRPAATPVSANGSEAVGKIQVLNGSSAGRELVLNKALTTLGKPGVQVAVITKRPNGYFITHVEGKVFPIVNGATAGAQAFALKDHDVIELAGVKMEFYLSRG
jgi:pSer/pThr/pTyr-binding forkhead associated (FHA) protein